MKSNKEVALLVDLVDNHLCDSTETPMRLFSSIALYSIVTLVACSSRSPQGSDSSPAESTPPDTSASADSGAVEAPDPCGVLGLPKREWIDAEDSRDLGATAADFEVDALTGPLKFSEMWSGCETYLFIQDQPNQASGWPRELWDRDVGTFLDKLPENTHVLFFSTASGKSKREEILGDLEKKVKNALKSWDEEAADWRRERLHYVTTKIRNIEEWLGLALTSPGWGLGVDRFQRIRYIGSYADPTRYNSDYGWFEPNLSKAANEAIFYNFEAIRAAEMEATNADVFPIWEDESIGCGWTGICTRTSVELPDAETMSGYDTLELDINMECVGDGEYGDCPPWDYLVYLHLCEDDNPESCPVEFGRWITTYHREGRWVHDVSGLLPYLQSGGIKNFAFETTQTYEIDLSLRLSNSGKAEKPVSLLPLFNGGGFGSTSNEAYEPLELEIPATAKKVELAYVISGHGMSDTGNCAEFCVTDHHFGVNGTDNLVSLSDAGVQYGCEDQVSEGTVPNQYGTWWYGRSNWCPGREVQLKTLDITDQVTAGENSLFTYEGLYNGAPFSGSGASMRLKSWVVISE